MIALTRVKCCGCLNGGQEDGRWRWRDTFVSFRVGVCIVMSVFISGVVINIDILYVMLAGSSKIFQNRFFEECFFSKCL